MNTELSHYWEIIFWGFWKYIDIPENRLVAVCHCALQGYSKNCKKIICHLVYHAIFYQVSEITLYLVYLCEDNFQNHYHLRLDSLEFYYGFWWRRVRKILKFWIVWINWKQPAFEKKTEYMLLQSLCDRYLAPLGSPYFL